MPANPERFSKLIHYVLVKIYLSVPDSGFVYGGIHLYLELGPDRACKMRVQVGLGLYTVG
jgi:hypothetical protein